MLILKNVIIDSPNIDLQSQLTDILINKNGVIEKVGIAILPPKGTKVFEQNGAHVSVGWMDIGVQTCDPGFEHQEDLNSTMQAARAGGFTSVAPFPNNKPATHSKSEILYIKNQTKDYLVDFMPIGALSVDCKGRDIAEMLDMYHAGAVAFGDGSVPTQDSGLILRGLQYAKIFDGLIMNFPFDKSVAPHGQMHEGFVSTTLGLSGIPSMAEELTVQRDLQLLEYADSKLHFHNISTAGSVALIRAAKKRGLKVTASVAVMNLCFDDSKLQNFDANFKVMPPLREALDVDALIIGVQDGTIDYISSNHTPVDTEGKDLEFAYSQFGVIGLETAFSMLNTYCKTLTVNQLVKSMAIQPRKVLGLKMPEIKEGSTANLTIFNPEKEWLFTEKNIYSKSKNTPLIGQILRGQVEGVVNNSQFWLRPLEV